MNVANNPIQYFSANTHGRDFIVGDIHGCFDQLNNALNAQNFNPDVDRCFTVGDLVDRGPYSNHVIEWLEQPWFHSCLGNHEAMLIDIDPDSPEGLNWCETYGCEWWLELNQEQRRPYQAAFSQLPILMEISTGKGKVGIIHADVAKGVSWSRLITLIRRGDENVCKQALWGRQRINSLIPSKVKDIDKVICGHTVTNDRQIKKSANIWFIDTGAFMAGTDGKLTLLTLDALFE